MYIICICIIYIYIQYTRFTTRELPQQSWLNRGSGSGALWFGPHFPMAGSQDPDPSDVDPVDPVLTKVEWPDTEEESSIQDLPPPVPCLATSLLIEAVGRSRQSPNSPCSSPRDEKRSTLAYRDHEVYISHSGSFLISNV